MSSSLVEELAPTQWSMRRQIVKRTINDFIVKQELPASATNLIITTPCTSCMYFLPKIHKPNNPGRPNVSACSCPTELISSYLDKIMAPIVRSLRSYVKDSENALQIFRDFNFLDEDKLIFTLHITCLYTDIPNGEGLLAVEHFFQPGFQGRSSYRPLERASRDPGTRWSCVSQNLRGKK